MIPLITSKLNLHTEYLQIIQVTVADLVFSGKTGKKYFLGRLSPGEPLRRQYVTHGASDRIMARRAQRQIARFFVMNLRNSGQVSRAIYTLSRIILHHNLFVPDSIRVSLIHHHQTPDSMTSPHYFPESTKPDRVFMFFTNTNLALVTDALVSAHKSWTEKVIVIVITTRTT